MNSKVEEKIYNDLPPNPVLPKIYINKEKNLDFENKNKIMYNNALPSNGLFSKSPNGDGLSPNNDGLSPNNDGLSPNNDGFLDRPNDLSKLPLKS